jgi:hypothetical protein
MMERIVERLKDIKSTLPGVLGLVGVAIALFKDVVAEVIKWISDMGYTLTPDTEKIVMAVVAIICIKMIFFEGDK